MRSLSLLPRSYSGSSSLYKDKPTKHRGNHHLLVLLKLKPVLFSIAAVCVWFSVIGLVQIHETLNVAIKVTSAPNELKIPVQPKLIESVQHRLLLATHNVLAWYYPQYDTMEVIHKGQVRALLTAKAAALSAHTWQTNVHVQSESSTEL